MLKKSICTIVVAVFLLQSLPAFADRRSDRGPERGHYRGHYGYVVHRIPPFYRTIWWGGLSYLYCEGLFYRHSPYGYIVVEPPVGAIIPTLPAGYTTVVIQRRPYYFYGDTYYVVASNGFVVAEPPAEAPPTVVPVAQPGPVAEVTQPIPVKQVRKEAKPTDDSDIDTYEIHIPNDNGSYTLVTLKKTDKGFLGPQGEFYNDHPTVEQLKARYAKK